MSDNVRKKLIEVALPLEAINAACKSDKDRKTGTIRNLHKWFAPMPVPALRALIFAALVDDPDDDDERAVLLQLIEALVASVVESPPPRVLAAARRAIRESVGELPTVLDPFCGAGSTLVEAQRLGLPGRGSDLNPIPVLISKMLTEMPPALLNQPAVSSQGMLPGGSWSGLSGFLADVEHYAHRVRDEAWAKLGSYYPPAPNGDTVIAWWWARTVESPDPRFQGVQVPIVSSWWVSRRPGERAHVVPTYNEETRSFDFAVSSSGQPEASTKGVCLASGSPMSFEYIKQAGRDGRAGTRLLAIVGIGGKARSYLSPTEEHETVARIALDDVTADAAALALPDDALGFTFQLYGNDSWSDLFTARQTKALATFAEIVSHVPTWVADDGGSPELATAVTTALALCVGKLAQASSRLVRWNARATASAKAEPAFARPDVSMNWDFAETNPFGGSVGDWMQIVQTSSRAFGFIDASGPASRVVQGDARKGGDGLDNQCLVVTDPPYFSAIGYANLSDYFYLWVRRALRDVYPDLLATRATPKSGELIAEPARHASKDEAKQYFIDGFTEVFGSLRRASRPDLPLLIVYAFKEQEDEKHSQVSSGWEAMLEAVIRSGLTVGGTWPVHGTGSARMRSQQSNALATYVVLVCRPRSITSTRVARRDLTMALRSELGPAIRLLQSAAIAPVDMAQAVIGPGMAVFTRYESVLEPDGSAMSVRSALLLINSVLAEVLEEQEGDFDAETRWAITWFEQHRFGEAASGEADALARAKVTSIEGLERSGIIGTRGGKTRLLARDELPSDYDPSKDVRPTIWEAVQHLVKRFEAGGEEAAARLLARIVTAEGARELAYRLYAVCERRNWTEDAVAFNVLVASWPEIARLAQTFGQGASDGRLPGLS